MAERQVTAALPPDKARRLNVGKGRLCRPLDYVDPPSHAAAEAFVGTASWQSGSVKAQHDFRVSTLTSRSAIGHKMPIRASTKAISRRMRESNVLSSDLATSRQASDYVDRHPPPRTAAWLKLPPLAFGRATDC